MEMYLAGVSVRRVEDITEALWGIKVSAGTVSKLNKKMYDQHLGDIASSGNYQRGNRHDAWQDK